MDKDAFQDMLKADAKRLGKLQERLYAEGRWAVLVILQGMDASGKDGIIENALSGVNPQGCEVHLVQTAERPRTSARFPLAHDARGCRSAGASGSSTVPTMKEVLVVRVHPEYLGGAEAAGAARQRQHLEGALRGHRRLREAPRAQRHTGSEVLPQHVAHASRASRCCSGWRIQISTGSSTRAT